AVDGRDLAVTSVSVGNPHCVIVVPDVDAIELESIGPKIENHPAFPNRTNVQFVQILGRDRVKIIIWERGAGVTLASGSSSTAGDAYSPKAPRRRCIASSRRASGTVSEMRK